MPLDYTSSANFQTLLNLATQTLLNNTDKVTKIAPFSVIQGLLSAVASVGQSALKDVALADTRFNVDFAADEDLDEIGTLYGVTSRLPATNSSTYVRLVADAGTTYPAGTIFESSTNISFTLDSVVRVGSSNISYGKVTSTTTGESANVPALSINAVADTITGHRGVFNDFAAQFGSDAENDDRFRTRIKEGFNTLSTSTQARLEFILKTEFPDVLRLVFINTGDITGVTYGVVPVNGSDFTETQLNEMAITIRPFLSASDSSLGGTPNILFRNIEYTPIDVQIFIERDDLISINDIYTEISVRFNNELNYTLWNWERPVEWDNLLAIVKRVNGVRYVDDSQFTPRADIHIPLHTMPRFRRLTIFGLDGILIRSGGEDTLRNYFYPNTIENAFNNVIT